MPELVHVARMVGRLKRHLVGKSLRNITAVDSPVVFHNTNSTQFCNALEGRKVLDAKSWGKYFWLEMDKPPHPLMHFGEAGWMYFKNDPYSHYLAKENPKLTVWPPLDEIFRLNVQGSDDEASFADARRLSRIQLMDLATQEMRNHRPLINSGLDPLQTPITPEWLRAKFDKHVPVKNLLTDQKNIAGLGRWMGDEILYQARVHPELQGRKLSDAQVIRICRSIEYVTRTAHEVDADSTQYPEHWLRSYRLDPSKRNQLLENGEVVAWTRLSGRSAYVPSAQVKSRIEKGPNMKKIIPTTELIFEMKEPPRKKHRIPDQPLRPAAVVVQDNGNNSELDKDVMAPLSGERPVTAGDVHRPPPTKGSLPWQKGRRSGRGHWRLHSR